MAKIFADKFESDRELQEWVISFYEEQIQKLLKNVGGFTDHNVKVTSRLIQTTMIIHLVLRIISLLEKTQVEVLGHLLQVITILESVMGVYQSN